MILRRCSGASICRVLCVLFWSLSVTVIFASGCGKKALPIPPNRMTLDAVSDFRGTLKDSELLLSWSLPLNREKEPVKGQVIQLHEVRVYRSKISIREGGCQNCPPRFEMIARSSPPSGGKGRMKFSDSLERGFRYTYKVVLVGENEEIGRDSDLFDLTY